MSYEVFGEPDEGPVCEDCDAPLAFEEDGPRKCDACREHADEECGADCPVVCGTCNQHHFGSMNPCASVSPSPPERQPK